MMLPKLVPQLCVKIYADKSWKVPPNPPQWLRFGEKGLIKGKLFEKRGHLGTQCEATIENLCPALNQQEQTWGHGRDPGATVPWSPPASWHCRRGPWRGLLPGSLGLAAVGPIAWKPSQNKHPWVLGWLVSGCVGVSRRFRVKRLNFLLTDPLEISHFNNKRNVTIL